jgi:Predicted Zn-dependent proteases
VRYIVRLFWITVLIAGIFAVKNGYISLPPTLLADMRQSANRIVSEIDTSLQSVLSRNQNGTTIVAQGTPNSSANASSGPNQSSDSTQTSTDATPTEPIIQGLKLGNTYYFHFEKNASPAVRQVFESAVKTYNDTGIVKLVAGTGTFAQNQITFSVYHKSMDASQLGLLELGKGGPEIIQQVGYKSSTINHAQASLNITYDKSISRAVAIHEVGHALGLNHSENRDSVMYPIDQGKTRLSSGDLSGLRAIYG